MATIRVLLSRLLCLVTLGMAGQAMAADDANYQQFIGDWELVSYLQFPEAGGEHNMNYVGYLSYDAQGNMAGFGMPQDLPERAAQSNERIMAGFAYWGTVSVNQAEKIVTHHVQGSPMVPQWVGGDNVRYFEFVDDLLKLSLKNSAGRVTGTLTWKRLR